ncbi:MAG: GNAT family N-acetyltransferase [Limimaricola soesokkakensis]|uniref:GNAT family N-acetyltransferase n=1 Tax=Limimaricola soesokkakensis TaxID=1343159 RepID=UPI0040585FF2
MSGPSIRESITGTQLQLRLVQPYDAEYIHGLRNNKTYNTYLSQASGTAVDQRQWIEKYKAREAALQELYYIIQLHDGKRCGTIRIYDIGSDGFTWGSWILDHNKPRKAALESAVLSFGVGFEWLGLDRAKVDVRIGNTRAEAFYRRLGMTETHRTRRDIFFTYTRARFDADKSTYLSLLERERRNA